MKKLATITLVLAIIGSALVLVLSLWPGVVPNILFFAMLTIIFWLPVVGIAGLVVLILVIRMSVKNPIASIPVNLRFVLAGFVILASLAVAAFGIPRRIVFLVFRPRFQQLVDSSSVSEYEEKELGRRIGIWRVGRYGADPCGGVYFRTATGPDGIGPDQMSYGFAYKPNTEGSPFGNAHYHTKRLTGDWYYFHVSDDW